MENLEPVSVTPYCVWCWYPLGNGEIHIPGTERAHSVGNLAQYCADTRKEAPIHQCERWQSGEEDVYPLKL